MWYHERCFSFRLLCLRVVRFFLNACFFFFFFFCDQLTRRVTARPLSVDFREDFGKRGENRTTSSRVLSDSCSSSSSHRRPPPTSSTFFYYHTILLLLHYNRVCLFIFLFVFLFCVNFDFLYFVHLFLFLFLTLFVFLFGVVVVSNSRVYHRPIFTAHNLLLNLMVEQPDTSEAHGHTVFVTCFGDLFVLD